MLVVRSACVYMTPVSITATVTEALPVVTSQASRQVHVRVVGGIEAPELVETRIVRRRRDPVEIVRLRVEDARLALELGGDRGERCLIETDELQARCAQAVLACRLVSPEDAATRHLADTGLEADDQLSGYVRVAGGHRLLPRAARGRSDGETGRECRQEAGENDGAPFHPIVLALNGLELDPYRVVSACRPSG